MVELQLAKNSLEKIIVSPRWPQRYVEIDPLALDALIKAQNKLPPDIRIILTRAYQREGRALKLLRRTGASIFSLIYPHRKNEITEIFGHNGHAADGKHIDISVEYEGSRIILLPHSVFTATYKIKEIKQRYAAVLKQVVAALEQSDFIIHVNETEALQIHCDWIGQ